MRIYISLFATIGWCINPVSAFAQPLSAYPFEKEIAAFNFSLQVSTRPQAFFARSNYLGTIEGIVDYFAHFQTADGRIIDPYAHREVQYSTPCYAWAASVLIAGFNRSNLVESAALALDNALEQLANGTPCDRHGDFFTVPCVLAYKELKSRVKAERVARWEACFRKMEPAACYSDLPGRPQRPVHNWNIVAATGEFLRHSSGFTGLEFVEQSLSQQMGNFTSSGLYQDPNTPMAYDHFPRHFLAVLLESGYQGNYAEMLNELIERGALTSLLMQSPLGELPTGGRSAQHQWNEAEQCVTYELAAVRAHRKNMEGLAGAYKRAAKLSFDSINRWKRPSGELWIVKNHFDPASRVGFESYSFHSQYNLLSASMLALAWVFADDSEKESEAPAEKGGFVIHLPEFHKIIANIRGLYLEIDTAADPHYNSTGLIRIHKIGVTGLIGPSDSVPAEIEPLAVGIGWHERSGWKSIAQLTKGKIKPPQFKVIKHSPSEISFSLSYELTNSAVSSIKLTYQLTAESIELDARVTGDTDLIKVEYPAITFDGRQASEIILTGAKALIRFAGAEQELRVNTTLLSGLQREGKALLARNGYVERISGIALGKHMRFTLTPRRNSSQSHH
jgi:hypothetical protein